MPAPLRSPSPAQAIDRWAPSPFACTCRSGDGSSLSVSLAGELDLATSPLFERTLAEAQDSAGIVSVDLRGLEFIDCAGLFVIREAAARAVRGTKELALFGASGQVKRVLELTGMPAAG